jgi:hypothetical protein
MFEDCGEEQDINVDISHMILPNIDTSLVLLITDHTPVYFNTILLTSIKLSSFFDQQGYLNQLKTIIRNYVDNFVYNKDFIDNINIYYQVFHDTNELELFYQICNIIEASDDKDLIISNINQAPLLQYYDIITHFPTRCLNQKLFKFNDYQHLLQYEASSFAYHKYAIKDRPICNNRLTDNFQEKFRELTLAIFDNLDWNNIVIAGGFLFGIINNAISSDIDIFIYSSNENIRRERWYYLLKYFSQYHALYHENQGVITIKIPNLSYPIQIIMMDVNDPNDVIDDFDMNYVKAYYNGQDVYANIDFLVALKYQLAIVDPFKINYNRTDIRIYKTINKGLNLLKNKYLQSTLIVDDIVDIDQYQKKEEGNNCYVKDYKQIEWHNNLLCFLAYQNDENAIHQFLTPDNVKDFTLKKTHLLVKAGAGVPIYDHFDNNGNHINIYLDVKYIGFTLITFGPYDYALVLKLDQEFIRLLTSYKEQLKIGNFFFDDKIRIKLGGDNPNHMKYYNRISDYLYNIKKLQKDEFCDEQYMKIICNVQFLNMAGILHANEDLFVKLTISKLCFLK